MKEKYYAVNQDSANYYNTIQDCINDLYTFVPPNEKFLDEEHRIIVYKLPDGFGQYIDESDLSYDDIYLEFYDNKLHFSDGRVVKYKKPIKKEYTLIGFDGRKYKVKAFNKIDAEKTLKNYLLGKH